MPEPSLSARTERERRTAASSTYQARVVNRLASDAERAGWRQAALQNLARLPDLFQYVGDERAADWRFLLPHLPRGRVLCLGGALSPVPITLASTCSQVVVVDAEPEGRFLAVRAAQEEVRNIEVVAASPGGGGWGLGVGDHAPSLTPSAQPLSPLTSGTFDLVALLRPSPGTREQHPTGERLRNLSPVMARDGHLYVEVDRPALRYPPASMRRDFKRAGLKEVAFYWPKPTFARCEMLMPLGDRRLQRYYLSHVFFAMSPGRQLLRGALAAIVRLGLFELTLPCYAAVASGEQGLGVGGQGSGPANQPLTAPRYRSYPQPLAKPEGPEP